MFQRNIIAAAANISFVLALPVNVLKLVCFAFYGNKLAALVLTGLRQQQYQRLPF